MKRQERIERQLNINHECYVAFEEAKAEMMVENPWFRRFRTTEARYAETSNYLLLKSKEKIVAVIDKRCNVCYKDMVWTVGSDRTVTQHINKFCHDFIPNGKLMIVKVV